MDRAFPFRPAHPQIDRVFPIRRYRLGYAVGDVVAGHEADVVGGAAMAADVLARAGAGEQGFLADKIDQVVNVDDVAAREDAVDRGLHRAGHQGARGDGIEAQIDAWKESYPDVNRIGLIIGEGHDDLIAEATMAAERHAIQLNVQVTHSDQETLYFFKRMAPDIDGFWLLPDNRVLSARVIRDILEEADKRKVSALVSTESMLPLGAALSIETVPADIADRLVEIVLEIEAGRFGSVPAVTPLTEMRITIRDSAQHRSIAQADAIAAEDTLQ